MRSIGRRCRRKNRSQGQALVEFSLVFIIFMTMFVGVIEFGVAFNVKMTVTFASRDAAVMVSESGAGTLSDCGMLAAISGDIMAPADKMHIVQVDIFWSDSAGNVKSGKIERYTPGGTDCPSGWTRSLNLYPASDRCAVINGAGCAAGHTKPDTVGVTVVYTYAWVTPLPGLVGLGGGGLTFSQTNLVNMEPIL